MRRIAALLAATSAALAAGTAFVATPAAAVVTCYTNYICGNDGGMYGRRILLMSQTETTACINLGVEANKMDWASNNSSKNWKVFENNCGSAGASSFIYAHTTGGLGGWAERINAVQRVA